MAQKGSNSADTKVHSTAVLFFLHCQTFKMIFLLILISSLTHVQSTNETSLYLCFMLPQWNGSSWSLLPFSTTSNLPSPGHNIFLGHLQRLSHYSTHSHLFLSEDICSSLSQLRTSVLPNTLGKFTCTSNHKFLTSPKIFLVHHQFVLNPEFSSFTAFPHWMTSSSEPPFRATSPAS